jgi:hypothetical protein
MIKNYRKYFGIILTALLCIPMFFASCKNEDESKSELCDITMFSVAGIAWNISGTEITRVYEATTEEGPLTPTIVLSPGAKVTPASGEAQNFFTEQGVKYTVTAENGVTTKTYTVKALRTPYSECSILSFKVDNTEWEIQDSIISRTYTDAVPGTMFTPVITLSPGATITPASGEAQDFFADGVRYTVTAENGTTKTYIAMARLVRTGCDILSFSVEGRQWYIDGENITATYEGLETSFMTPTITLSPGARINPASNMAHNFFVEQGVTYTVTAESGATKTYVARAFLQVGGATGACQWRFLSTTGVLTISGHGAMLDFDISNPDMLPPWDEYRYDIKSIVIEEGVTNIGNMAFMGDISEHTEPEEQGPNSYDNLISVTIPNSVTSIGYGAFKHCRKLTSITLGNSVTTIGDHAFYECKQLASITFPNSVTSIGASAFFHCQSLTSLVVGNSVTTVGRGALFFCPGVTSLTIPESLTDMGFFSFGGFETLEEVINLSPVPQDIEKNKNAQEWEDPNLYFFGSIDTKNITLKVPSGSINAYRTAPIWKDFKNYVGI